MSIWTEMTDEMKVLVKQWLKDESVLTAAQLTKLAEYMLRWPDTGYELAYRKATPWQKLEMRKRTDAMLEAGIAKAKARKAARQELMLKIIQGIISVALLSVSKELE